MIHPAIQAAEIRAFANFSNEKKPAAFTKCEQVQALLAEYQR